MVGKQEIEEQDSGATSERALTRISSIALQALTKAAPYFGMASKYVTYLERMDQFLTEVHRKYTNRS
ncbi:fungal specific transcription factor [Colletotrichum abscissum]|uniref:fungal specific transcription factor n=1 Tax=Colletotrichum abscissum TaxID=1671311 RepID=UPI0027D5E56D|nr:fungal specific transcription factor [Colletotrichum abscissum]KAK1507973.1 fungal specific transcription factor [Colletotrichum abscissum]